MSQALRVIQVVNVRWFNATAWYGVELARLLAGAGHPSLVVGLEGTAPLVKATELGLDTLALPLNTTNPLRLPGLLAAMDKTLARFRPDLVNCHRGEAFVFWAALKQRHPFALVRTRGDQRLPRNTLLNRRLHSRAADAVVATNSAMARHFREQLGIPPERLHTILGGVDRQRFAFNPQARAAVRAACGYTDADCVVGLLGRFDAVKGQKETLDALASLVAQGLDHLRLLLIGFTTATRQEEVEAWIRERGLERQVRITGRVDEVPAYLAALDLGLVASQGSEAIARAALEIMACQRPLIATSVGVMPDLLPAEALVPPGDGAALSHLLGRAATDPAWREKLATQCAARMQGTGAPHSGLGDNDFLAASLSMYHAALRIRRGA